MTLLRTRICGNHRAASVKNLLDLFAPVHGLRSGRFIAEANTRDQRGLEEKVSFKQSVSLPE